MISHNSMRSSSKPEEITSIYSKRQCRKPHDRTTAYQVNQAMVTEALGEARNITLHPDRHNKIHSDSTPQRLKVGLKVCFESIPLH